MALLPQTTDSVLLKSSSHHLQLIRCGNALIVSQFGVEQTSCLLNIFLHVLLSYVSPST